MDTDTRLTFVRSINDRVDLYRSNDGGYWINIGKDREFFYEADENGQKIFFGKAVRLTGV